MKVYELVDGFLTPGCPVHEGRIVLGQAGRGRKRTDLPLPRGCVIDGDRVIAIPAASDGAWVVIRDHSGFRGGWDLCNSATTVKYFLQRMGAILPKRVEKPRS